MQILPIIKGLTTYIPGHQHLRPRRGEGSAASPTYCYNVWLKHLTILWENGLKDIPSSVGEIGPGGSLGVGLAAMLSGANHYYALDVKKYSSPEKNLKMLDDLVDLFRSRTPCNPGGWPPMDDYLDGNLFPSHILTDDLLARTLSDERIDNVREALKQSGSNDGGIKIHHIAPWSDATAIESGSLDLILSHSVMEHVNDLGMSYEAMAAWIKPGGYMSHQIDLSGHNVTREWNGYRQYPDFVWKVIVGSRPYLINREPCSAHIDLLRKNGFTELCCIKKHDDTGIERPRLSGRWKHISDEDLRCRGLFIQVQRLSVPFFQDQNK